MKSVVSLIWVTALTVACSGAAIGRPANASAIASSAGAIAQDPAPPVKRGHGKQPARPAKNNLAGLKGTVVSEMRATKAFVKENVVKPASTDRGLMLLAGVGMIVLQLRRKHKSLPQRPIAPYA